MLAKSKSKSKSRKKPTRKQLAAMRRNIKKAQAKWKSMSHAARVKARRRGRKPYTGKSRRKKSRRKR